MMGEQDLSVLAELLKAKGIPAFLVFILGVSIIISIPIILLWIKESIKRKGEKNIYYLLRELTDKITILVNQYNENISLPMVEAILTPVLQNGRRELTMFIDDVLIRNNLEEEKASIENRILMVIENIWKQNDTWLSKFKYKGIFVSSFINLTWKDEIYKVIVKTIYDHCLSPDKRRNNVKKYLEIEFENIFHDALKRIEKH